MRRTSSEGAGPAEETMPRTDKEFMTKAEYNRWLVKQQNAKMAEETREEAKTGEEVIKERMRKHTQQGLSRCAGAPPLHGCARVPRTFLTAVPSPRRAALPAGNRPPWCR